MDELLKQFIDEARDLVESASKDFLKVEENPTDMEILNSLFRVMHTIKGSSGIFEFLSPLTNAVHVGEDVLDAARDGRIVLNPDIIDIFLDLLDQINIWLDELEEKQKLSDDAEDISRDYKEKLMDFLKITKDISEDREEIEKELGSKNIEIKWLKKIKDNSRREIFLNTVSDKLFAINYVPDENCFFTGDDPILTIKNIPSLVWCGVEFKESMEMDEFDPFINYLEFYAVSDSSLEELKQHFQYVEDQVDIQNFSIEELMFPTGDIIKDNLLETFIQQAREDISSGNPHKIKDKLKIALEIVSPNTLAYSCLKWMEAILEKQSDKYNKYLACFLNTLETNEFKMDNSSNIIEGDENNKETPQTCSKLDLEDETLAIELIETQIKMLNIPSLDNELEIGRIKSALEVTKRCLLTLERIDLISELQHIDTKDKTQVIAKLGQVVDQFKKFKKQAEDVQKPIYKKSSSPSLQEQEGDSRIKSHSKTEIKVLKVDQHRIDSLMELVSELVVAKNSLPYLAKKAEDIFGSRELSKELKFQYATINRICEDLQNEVMQIRMVPISHIFQRFPRLVREFSRKLNKKIELVLEGEDTKADKTVVEDLAEPLVHLIRNSIDHGIESPEERASKGKPEKGKIILRAISLEDQVIIEVIDDGRGIDVDKVKKKAYERGLISETDVDKISDEDVLQYIFAPGLSTADKISDLSGRGVGMDVVRNMVENVGGSIKVFSEKNKGTTVRINLPLSMAVTRILMVEVSKELFGFPIENVAETVKIPKSDIKFIKNKETIVLRDRLIPIYRLKNVLDLDDYTESSVDCGEEEVAILIIQLKNTEFGIIVDKFHEGVDIVLKPLEGIMSRYTLYSGATLLGDGRVLLVINPKELIKWL